MAPRSSKKRRPAAKAGARKAATKRTTGSRRSSGAPAAKRKRAGAKKSASGSRAASKKKSSSRRASASGSSSRAKTSSKGRARTPAAAGKGSAAVGVSRGGGAIGKASAAPQAGASRADVRPPFGSRAPSLAPVAEESARVEPSSPREVEGGGGAPAPAESVLPHRPRFESTPTTDRTYEQLMAEARAEFARQIQMSGFRGRGRPKKPPTPPTE